MNGKLQFQAYRKPNQIIKYISIESHHAPAQLFNVARSEFERLISLTTMNNITLKMKPEEIYPEHVKKLKDARLWRQTMDSWTFKIILKNKKSEDRKEKKRKEMSTGGVKGTHTLYQHGQIDGTSIFLKEFEDKAVKYGVKWLCFRFSKGIHQSFACLLAGDRNRKLMETISSKDFCSRDCNCCKEILMRIGGTFPWNRLCRQKVIVYKITCRICESYYIGTTQNTYKQHT